MSSRTTKFVSFSVSILITVAYSFVRQSEISEAERAFLNTLLVRDFHKRPTFEQLKRAIDGDGQTLRQLPGLKWLSQVGDAATGDTETSFAQEMAKRIKGYGEHKNVLKWYGLRIF